MLDPRTLDDAEAERRRGRRGRAALAADERDRRSRSAPPGHIDHGKTALIAALTGKDTDRLPEEHARGISIELGYAPLELPSGRRLSVVDVPGHERFVRTMVAGATGVDLFLLCVAADDGVMPQTREHLAVLRGLGVTDGVVAITKADTARSRPRPRRGGGAAAGRRRSCAVSALRRTGLDELLAALDDVAARAAGARRAVDGGPRGSTSTARSRCAASAPWSPGRCGRARSAPATRSRPAARARRARVRSVQVHDRAGRARRRGPAGGAEPRRASAGASSAAATWSSRRGDLLAASYRLDVSSTRPVRLERGARVQVHHGTREAPGARRRRSARPRAAAAGGAARGGSRRPRRAAPDRPAGHARRGGWSSPRRASTARAGVVDGCARSSAGRPREPRSRRSRRAPSRRPSREPLDDAALRSPRCCAPTGTPRAPTATSPTRAGIDPRARRRDRLGRLEQAGQAVRVGRNLHFHPESAGRARGARDRHLRARRRGYDRGRARRARHLAQVRAGAARAPRPHQDHAPRRRRHVLRRSRR